MYNFRLKFELLPIRSKILTAFLIGCIAVVFAWVISQIVFKETFKTIAVISTPNPKLIIINTLFQKIQRLDYSQKLQVLKIQDQPQRPALDESNTILKLLDSLKIYCREDTVQVNRILRMQTILYERDQLFFNYMKFRYSIQKNNPLSKGIHNLSDYVSKNIRRGDSNVVKTTKKNTITTTTITPEEGEKKVSAKKEPFFKRVFNRKKTKEDPVLPVAKLVTENVEETIDTFAVTQRDSFMKDMERAILSIEKDRFSRRHKLLNHELKLASASNIFIDELEQLLRQVQSEEIRDLQNSTELLSGVFNNAFYWVEIILGVFLFLILALILLIFSDISQSNQVRLQLVEAKEKAEYLEQVKHRFLANMSHEIRTPLQAIIGYSEQIKDQDRPEKQSLEAIHHSSEHLLQIVNEVLDYSRIISGKFVFEKQDFGMEELIAEVADIMEGQAERKKIAFRMKSNIPRNQFYSGDPFRLKQILFNLLGNAIKFTNQGEVSFLVSTKEIGEKKIEFTFEIKDTGIGMTEEELKKIFNSFEQATETVQRQYGGTGLGLSIAKQLVGIQGGTILVESKKNEGSCFKVKLYFLKSSPNAVLQETPLPLNKSRRVDKVLVVDDDPFILRLCSTLLTKHAIPHLCYSSPEKVLEALWDDSVRIVLADIRMPGISGTELFRRLKKIVPPYVKFIALTAQALPEEKESVLRSGFDEVLLKPFREKDLLHILDKFVNSFSTENTYTEDRFDLSSIETMCMHEEGLFQKTLALLVGEMQKDLDHLTRTIELRDNGGIAESCHRLSAKVGQTGMHTLSASLLVIEKKARKRQPALLHGDALFRILNELKELISKLKTRVVQPG